MTFDTAYRKALKILDTNDSGLAGRFPVSRQALMEWCDAKNMPLLRALQMEKMTGLPWQSFAPKSAEILKRTPSADKISTAA